MFHAGLGFPGGFTGVDIFFVISGYLITSLIAGEMAERRFSVLTFYERRIRRIFPALFAMLGASTVAAWSLFMPPEFSLFGRSMALAALFSSNIGFWLESGYFDTIAQFKPLLHTWSLGVEEQFYIVFPLLLAALGRFLPGRRTAIIAVLTVASFLMSVVWVRRAPEAAFFLLPARFWELGTGSLLALVPSLSVRHATLGACLAAVGLALIAAAVFGISASTPFPGAVALLPCIGTALVIAAGTSANPLSRLLGTPPLVFVGLISYSLYLWHWPIIIFAQYRLGHLLTGSEAMLALAASLVAATLSWRFIEQPVRRRALLGRRRTLFRSGAAVAAASVALGLAIPAMGGLPGRLPPEVQKIYAVKQEASPFSGLDCFTDNNGAGLDTESVLKGKLCSMGALGGRVSFLVWGDSHAAAMAPAFDSAGTSFGRRGLFVGRGGCPPLIGYEYLSSDAAKRDGCRAQNNAVIDLLKRERIPLVFLVARWPREVLGAQNGLEGPFYDPAAPYPTRDRSEKVSSALDSTIGAMAALGVRAVLVMDVPEPGYDVPVSLARAALSNTVANVNPTRAAVDARQGLALKVLRQAAARWSVSIIDPTPWFCDAKLCRVELAGISRYRDADHITRRTALALAHLFDRSFAAQYTKSP